MNKIIVQDKILFPKVLWQRPVHFYKARAGKIFVLAGSKGMSGAAILTCEAVFRGGTGILTLGFPVGLKNIYKEILPEAMTLELPETPSISIAKKAEPIILENIKGCDVAIIGPGLSQNAETIQLIWQLIFAIEKPIVLDADGINALAKGIEVIRSKESLEFLENYFHKRQNKLILTPHPGEMFKIINSAKFDELKNKKIDVQEIEKNKPKYAILIAKKLNATVVLKGYETVISDPEGKVVMNKPGGPELATAGSGDVLSGIIGSFVGQNPTNHFEAICTAVYLHGLSGIIAKEKIGERSVIASDIIRNLPEAIKRAENEN
jgi:NAD(P)H-hydrate epimerase